MRHGLRTIALEDAMLRLNCFHSSCIPSLQHLLKHINWRLVSTKLQSSGSAIPEQWREGFTHTAAVPAGSLASVTAFSWAKKQAPHVSLAHLSKLFRQRQVRVLQHGHVKRVSRTRQLEPGDILLLPTQQQQQHVQSLGSSSSSNVSSSRKEAYAVSDEEDTSSLGHALHQQQQRGSQFELLALQEYASKDAKQEGLHLQQKFLRQELQQQQQQQQQEHLLLKEQQEVEQLIEQELAQIELQQQQHKQRQLYSGGRTEQQQQQQQTLRQRRQQQRQTDLTVPQIHKMVLASSRDIAVLYKPPGLSLFVTTGSSKSSKTLNPNLAEALNIRTPEGPQLICGLDDAASGAVVISRHAAAYEWLSAWVAGEPAAVAAAAAALSGLDSDDIMAAAGRQNRKGLDHRDLAKNPRARQQQQKLRKLAGLAAAGSSSSKGSSAAAAAARFTAKELRGLQQLMEGVGGLRFRRIFWAVVQGDLALRRSGTLSNRMLRGDEALPTLTRYKVLASRDGLTLLELQPLTNRPNQIRMQCGKVLQTPIIGDYKYGYRPWSNAPAAQPWLSRYIAKAEGAGSSRQQQQQPHAQHNCLISQDLHLDESSEDLNGDPAEFKEHLPVDFAAAGVPAGWGVSHDHAAAAAEPLLLHCREVVLLRPRKAPVRVIAPVPRNMKQLLHAMDWRG